MAQQFGFDLSPEDISSASAQTHQQVSPQTGGLDELSYVPWWKRKLLQMQTQDIGQGIQQAQGGGGESVVNNWASLGKGVGNLAKKLVGMEQGGVVQGPTHVLAGEAGEAEAFVPESKALPFALETLRTGKMPNPASLPRTEHRPPPPVILANTPAMACGGKVIPKMADGGVIDPFLNADPFAIPDFSASPMRALPPIPTAPPTRTAQASQAQPQMLSPDAASRLAEWRRQGAPPPKFYDRLFMGEGNGPMDMRPGVAPYSIAGRAAGKIIGSLLPYNKKLDDYKREERAREEDYKAAQAKDAAAIKQQELEQRGRATDAQVAASRSTEALRNKQSAAMDAPPPRKLRVTDYTNAETGDVTRVWNDENTGEEVKREVLGGVAKPKPTATSERNPTAASLAAVAANPNATPEERAAAEKALKLLKPPKPAAVGGSPASDDKDMNKLLSPTESAMLGVPYGTTRAQAAGKKPATEAQKITANYASRMESAAKIIDEIDMGWLERGYNKIAPEMVQTSDGQSITQAKRNFLNAVLRRESGAVISPSEFDEGNKQYFPMPQDDARTLAQKKANRDLVVRNFKSAAGNAYEPPPSLNPNKKTGEAGGAPAPGRQVRDKRTGDVRTLKPGQDVNAFVRQYPQFEAVAAKGKE